MTGFCVNVIAFECWIFVAIEGCAFGFLLRAIFGFLVIGVG